MKVKMQIMIEPELKQKFKETCKRENAEMSEIVRQKVREYIKEKETYLCKNRNKKRAESYRR